MLVLAALGLPLLGATFLWFWLEASPNSEDCWECGEFFGRWMSGALVFFLLVNIVTWAVGALAGWALRTARTTRDPSRPLY